MAVTERRGEERRKLAAGEYYNVDVTIRRRRF